MAAITYIRVSKANLSTIPIVDGQIVFTRDTGEIFYDMGATRLKASDYIEIPGIAMQPRPGISGKLYLALDENNLYRWDSTDYKKLVTMTASEVSYVGAVTGKTNVKAAIDELKTQVDAKIAKSIATSFVGSSTFDKTTGDGFKITTVNVILADGTSASLTTTITLDDMGAASADDLDQVVTDTTTALAGKVDKTTAGGPVVKSVALSANATNGFDYVINLVSLADGTTSQATGTLTASDMSLATVAQFTDLQAQIDTIRGGLLRYELDFAATFSTATPTKAQTDTWLESEGKTAQVGTSFKNSNSTQSTYQHVFVYYVDETVIPQTDPLTLKLVDDGIDSVTTATDTTLGVVRGGPAGDLTINVDGDMTVKAGAIDENKLAGALKTKIDGKVDKVVPTVAGNVAALSPEGGLVDTTIGIDRVMQKVTGAITADIATYGTDGQVVDSGVKLADIVSGTQWVEGD